MNTRQKIDEALKDAMRARDESVKRTLRLALSTIKLSEVEKGRPLEEPEVVAVLQKEVKTRQETISEAERAGRADMVSEAKEDVDILKRFLPQGLSPQELRQLVQEAIAESGATSPADMGKVMKVLSPRLAGRASGGEASQMVRQLLEGR